MFAHLDDALFDLASAGRKAGNLHRLLFEGIRVPPGLVIPPSADLHLVEDDELAGQVARIGGFPVAVRASGAREGRAEERAGPQLASVFDVKSVGELRARVAECRARAASPRLRPHLERRGHGPEATRPSILVQHMVDARLSGVGFTNDPSTGGEGHALVECCAGLGDRLGSGRVRPTSARIALRDGSILAQTAGEDGIVLDRADACDIASALLRVQAVYGVPQAVAWAIDRRGRLWILQSRPITSIVPISDLRELTSADFKDGSAARVCTPLELSLHEHALQVSMQGYCEDLGLVEKGRTERWGAARYGRFYWNAGAFKDALARVPGFDEETFAELHAIQRRHDAGGRAVRVPATFGTVVPALALLVKRGRSYARQLVRVRAFATAFAERYETWRAKVARLATTDTEVVLADLLTVLHDLHAWTEETHLTTIYTAAAAQSDLRSLVARMDAATGRPTSLPTLLGGLPGLPGLDLQRSLLALVRTAWSHGLRSPELDDGLVRFLDEQGFHADGELDLTLPRWSDDPARVRRMVAAIASSGVSPADPEATSRGQRAAHDTELAAVRAALAARSWLRLRFQRAFEKRLARARAYVWARAQMSVFSAQCHAIVHAYAVEAGARLATAGKLEDVSDIFMLSIGDLRELVQRRLPLAAMRAEIGFRRALYRGYRHFRAPDELTTRAPESRRGAGAGRRHLAGIGCSRRRVEGTVRIVASVDEIHLVRPGDVLVTRSIDPGWTPMLGLVGGVIVEVGGPLSHAAVAGRELGIAVIAGVRDATGLLETGMRVRVDGARGTVEILDELAAAPQAKAA